MCVCHREIERALWYKIIISSPIQARQAALEAKAKQTVLDVVAEEKAKAEKASALIPVRAFH